MNARRVLVVANITATGAPLVERVQTLMREAPSRFTLLVPTGEGDRTLMWEENEVWHQAEEQMKYAVEFYRGLGVEVDGRVGDRDPVTAVTDLLLTEPHDLIVVSTLPRRTSRWLSVSLPDRLERATHLPVVHIIATDEVLPPVVTTG